MSHLPHSQPCHHRPALDRQTWPQIDDGAGWQEDGVIARPVGHYADLRKRYSRNTAVIGSGPTIMLPGFVNGHHHVGLTPVQLARPTCPLELWVQSPHGGVVTRNRTLSRTRSYSAFRDDRVRASPRCSTSTAGLPGTFSEWKPRPEQVIRAYEISACGCPTAYRCSIKTG